VLLAAALFYGVAARDPGAALLFAVLLLLPGRFPLFNLFRALHPTVGAGMLGVAVFSLPVAEIGIREAILEQEGGVSWQHVFAHVAMLVGVWKSHHARLASRDHYFLLVVSLALVLLGHGGGWSSFALPLLLPYVVVAVADLVLLHLANEEQRVLDLARVRGFERELAEEVAGRGSLSPSAMLTALSMLAVGLVLAGVFIAWLTPLAVRGVKVAWNTVGGRGGEGEDPAPPTPEWEEPVPPFEIPPGTRGMLPFGPRLERAEFLARSEFDGLALLVRSPIEQTVPRGLLIRGECYDYLAAGGTWIRARSRPGEIHDAEDGSATGKVVLPVSPVGHTFELEYLVPPGRDRTIYAQAIPGAVSFPVVATDGVGNLLVRAPRSPRTAYRVLSTELERRSGQKLSNPGPEFLLLPPDLDRARLASEVAPLVIGEEDPFAKVEAVREWMAQRLIHVEEEILPLVAEDEEEEPEEVAAPPTELDVAGFLFERSWGRSIDFATAFAALLRSVSIPCRLATGYHEGAWLVDAEFWVFRAHDVHVWVEVPFEGMGWVAFDPTPDALMLPEDRIREILELPPEERAAEAERVLEEAERKPLVQRLLDRLDAWISTLLFGDRKSSAIGKVLAWIVLLLGGGILLRTVLFFLGRGQALLRREMVSVPRPPLLPFYERLMRALGRHGMRRFPSQTPVEFARAVVGTWGPDLEEVRRLTNAFCAHRYGGVAIGKQAASKLMERVGRLEAFLRERFRSRRKGKAGAAAVVVLLLSLLIPGGPADAQDPRALVEMLGSPEREVRLQALTELREMGPRAVPALLALIESSDPVRIEQRVAELIRDLDADDFGVRQLATDELVRIGDAARPALEVAAREGSPEVRRRASMALERIRGAARPEASGPREVLMARHAIYLLSSLAGAGEVDAIAQAGLARPELAEDVAGALAGIALRALPQVLALLDRPDPDIRRLAVRALGRAGLAEARPRILRILLEDPSRRVKADAAFGLVTAAAIEETDRARRLLSEKKPREAEAALREVLKAAPGYAEAGVMLAGIVEATGRAEAALPLVDGLVMPVAERERIAARLLLAMGDRDGARARLDDARDAAPGHTADLVRIARVYLVGQTPLVEEALRHSLRAVRESPFDPEVYALLGLICGRFMNQPTQAQSYYMKAVTLDPHEPRYREALKRYSPR
jgi:transglutaminase-like putative cysteine protease/HEAT repeat protein